MSPLISETELHGMVVHFPIALLFVAVGLELVALYAPWREKLRPAAVVTLVLGTISAALAVASGPDENLRGIDIGHLHESMAKLTLLIFAVLTLWKLFGVWKKHTFNLLNAVAFLIVGIVGLGVLSYTGWLGGQLVYQHAAGVKLNGQLVAPPPARGNFRPRNP